MSIRAFLYFFLAVIPTLLQAQPPATKWQWATTLLMQSLYQGLLAIKALQSQPDQPKQ